jgi:hypothetical protein
VPLIRLTYQPQALNNSDDFRFWHETDVRYQPINVCLLSKSGSRR